MYAKKYFDIKELKKINIQQEVGVYYRTGANNIKKEYYNYFDIDTDDMEHFVTFTSNDFDKVINDYEIEYAFTDEEEINEFVENLMNYKKYSHYLVVLFNATWTGSSGYKIFDNYFDTFYRDYDVTMYYKNGTKGGKAITLTEYSHDVPMGHNSVIIGLTENEYNKLENKDIEEIIAFGRKFI